MNFSDADGAWQEVPPWAGFLLELGFEWVQNAPGIRRIGVVSMPCDSAAAGLIALGALRSRLELNTANDLASHFARIQALVLHGDTRTCLFDRQFRGKRRGPYVLDGQFAENVVRVKLLSSPDLRRSITLASADDWQFEGEPPVVVLSGDRIPYQQHYAELVTGRGMIAGENLARSDSGICLAGRVAGRTSTQDIMAALRLRAGGQIANLGELLTIHSWCPAVVSRVLFFNARTGELDRETAQPGLVVADGDASLLKVIDDDRFLQSDVIGVVHRTVERDRLDDIESKLANLSQWYVADTGTLGGLPPPAPGIALLALRRNDQ